MYACGCVCVGGGGGGVLLSKKRIENHLSSHHPFISTALQKNIFCYFFILSKFIVNQNILPKKDVKGETVDLHLLLPNQLGHLNVFENIIYHYTPKLVQWLNLFALHSKPKMWALTIPTKKEFRGFNLKFKLS